MKWLICFIRGHDARGQHVAYRGAVYQFRCRRCAKLTTHSWEKA